MVKRQHTREFNAKRLHSSIGYVPPNEFEKEVLNIRYLTVQK